MDLATVIAIPEAAVGLGVILLGGWKAVKFMSRVDDALPTVFEIHKEFSPNGGGSLKDRIEALHAGQEDLVAWSKTHQKEDTRNFTKVEAVLERIEDKLPS